MNIIKYLIFLFLIIGSKSIFSQTEIKGNASSYVGHEIIAYHFSDLFSMTNKKVGSAQISETGTFEMTLDLSKGELIKFEVNRVHTILFIDANSINYITIHKTQKNNVKTYANTVVSGDVEPGITDKLIKSFDKDYNNFIERSSFSLKLKLASSSSYQKARKENLKGFKVENDFQNDSLPLVEQNSYSYELKEFENIINQKFDKRKETSVFFNDYVNYYLANLHLIDTRKNELYEKFLNKELDYSNPAVANFINNFYSVIWETKFENSNKSLKSVFKSERNYYSLDTFALNFPFLQNETIRHIVLNNSLYSSYREGVNKELALMLLVREAKEEASFSDFIAKNLVNKIIKYKKGVPLADFKMLNKREDFVTKEDYKGKYIYFSFFTSWCTTCEADQYLIENLKKEYGNEIKFVSINMDDDYKDFKKFLSTHRKFNWDFLYGPSEGEVMRIFNLQSIPSYILIDPEGNWMYDNTRSPSEGVQIEMANIMRKGYVAPKTYKVWDD